MSVCDRRRLGWTRGTPGTRLTARPSPPPPLTATTCVRRRRVLSVTPSAAPITGARVNENLNYASSCAVHTLLCLSVPQQVPEPAPAWLSPPLSPPHQHPRMTRQEFVSVWSDGHICQERHAAMQDTLPGEGMCVCVHLCRESDWIPPPTHPLSLWPLRCLLFPDWLAGETVCAPVCVCVCVYSIHVCVRYL